MAQAIVQSSCMKLRSAIGDAATMRLNFTGDLQEMLEQLVAIDGVILNTEDWWIFDAQDEDGGRDHGEVWQTKVKDAAYRVCDMVDELQDMTVPAAAGTKMAKAMLACRDNTSTAIVEPDKSKEIMLDKMKEIKEKLKELHKESVQFDDVADRRALLQSRAATVGRVGREEDVEKIVAQLSACHSSEGSIVLLVRGEEIGVGKATVAAMVSEHDRFKFYSRIWIHHTDMLELHEVGKYIISQVSAGEEETTSHGLEDDMVYIKNRLHELLNGKKVLLVLHNLWGDASQWKRLKDMLSVGGMGSTQVIVIATVDTHEHNIVARGIFGVQPYCLGPLSEEMCCKIIKQAAVRSQDRSAEKEDLEQITPEVAKLCKGIPMAAQLFGSALQLKPYREWAELLEYEAFSQGPFVLSYRSMPANLRLCFAYCAFVFRTERDILKEDLIHQWFALDLIEPSEAFSTPQLAEQYLMRLLDMSLIQTANSSRTSAKDDTCAISFTMHVGVRNFAAKYICDVLGEVDDMGNLHSEHCPYALIVDLNNKPLKSIFPDHQKIRVLRCLDCSKVKLDDYSFSFARCLRVLEFHESSMQKLPESICQLRHLGYLKLSGWSGLVTLPESIGDLINLLHIDLSPCPGLVNLPGSFGKLINLVHISLSGCSKLKNLPESFRKLNKLMHISLSGCLALVNLPESFGELTKVVYINLSGCLALVNLPESFGKLTKLEHINLSGCHKLVNLRGSFGKLTNLVHINLSGCSGLSKLPESFGKLRKLSHINLSGCSALEELPESFGKLISLVHINLSGCSGLATLPGSFGDLQNLLHVDLSRCYGLSKLPESFGKLKRMVHLDLSFWSCFEGIQTALRGLTNVQHLNLSHPCCYHADYPHLEGLKQVLGQFIRLKHLNLSMFLNPIFCNQSEEKNREYIELISGFSRLEYLDLSDSIFLNRLPGSLAHLHRLHTLDLSGCIRLKKVGGWMDKMQSLKSVVLSNLESYQFVVGTDNVINNYRQLVDVRCKELEITCLEEMKSVAEPRRIRLAEKHNLEKLKLCWTVSSKRFVEDNALLGELVPPHSLQYLGLHGYSSTCFPPWLTSSISSLNLVEITMEDIPKCSHLPPLGLLPNLQRVVLKRMNNITRIDAGELSGGNTTAFNRLSRFTIDDMGSLKEFTYHSSGGGGEELLLQVIDKLVVHKCPNLSFVPLLPRARRLVISDCNFVMVCLQNKARKYHLAAPSCISSPVTVVTDLVVESCQVYLNHWCLLNHLSGLCSLTIKDCNNLVSSPEIVGALSSLQILCFSNCHQMTMLPEHLGGLRSLRKLHIKSCSQFLCLPDSMKQHTSLQSLLFSDCNSTKELPQWLGTLTSLQKLAIERCTSISFIPIDVSELINRKDLHIIINCSPRLECWGESLQDHLGPRLKMELTPTSEESSEIVEDA